MADPVHIIEPTLRDDNGHCFALSLALCQGMRGVDAPVHVWTETTGAHLFDDMAGITPHGHFRRRMRRPQMLFLLRRLLQEPGHLILPTARTTDFLLVDWAAQEPITEPGKVTFFIHWYNPSERKRQFLRKIAKRHPGMLVVGPVMSVVNVLRECGFQHAHLTPYPMFDVYKPEDRQSPTPYRGILYPGASRVDKGYPAVVDAVERLVEIGATDPLLIHTIPPSKGIYEPPVLTAIEKLRTLDYPSIDVLETTLSLPIFQAMFPGRISLLPFDPVIYADRVSTVSLEAWRNGSPVVVPAKSWMEPMVRKHNAGIVVDALDPKTLIDAVMTIKADFATYQQNAFAAGDDAMMRHDPSILMAAVRQGPQPIIDRLGIA